MTYSAVISLSFLLVCVNFLHFSDSFTLVPLRDNEKLLVTTNNRQEAFNNDQTTMPPICINDPCNAPSTCENSERMADPDNCFQYFNCNVWGKWDVVACPEGLWFDSRSCICRAPVNVTCATCDQPTGPPATSLPPGLCDGDNSTEPCAHGDKAADRSDCEFYYECRGGQWYREECLPAGRVFDIHLEDCVEQDGSVDCEYRCPTPAPSTGE